MANTPVPPLTLPDGTRLVRTLGSGGWSSVFEAVLPDGRPVAIKRLEDRQHLRPQAVARFTREAEIGRLLDHPGFVRVLQDRVIEGLGPAPVLVLELLRGEDVEASVNAAGPLDPEGVSGWVSEVAEALAHAHALGVVHRDVKPSNIFLCNDGRVVLLDLGLARPLEPDAADLLKTQQGAILGTPMFMAPEQARGDEQRAQPAVDVWGLGLTALFALTGEVYWRGRTSAELMAAVLTMPLYAPSTRWPWLPEGFDGWFKRSCARNPAHRYPDPRIQADALDRVIRGDLVGAEALLTQTLPLDTDWESLRPAVVPLPVPRTPLIGREALCARVRELALDVSHPLITLLGPGGTGKTRLALQVAHELVPDVPDGVCFVPLDGLGDPELVPTVVADALGLGEGDRRSDLERVIGWLRARRSVLVLDNFEHLSGAAWDVASMLTACPDLTILVTSRVAVNLREETRVTVEPLELPATGATDPAQALESPALRLLVDRVQAVKPDFALTAANLGPMVELARRLDGLPLALELAAGRMRLLPPEAVLERFGDRLSALSATSRDLPERQRTMRAAMDWSHELLTPDDQAVFRRLAVFAGSFSLDAAEALCAPDGLDAWTALEALADHSLVSTVPGLDGRFRMLRMIREDADRRLEEAGEAPAVRSRWAQAALSLAEDATEGSVQTRAWLRKLANEHENLRAVLAWLLDQRDPRAVRLAGSLTRFWYLHGHYEEGRRWIERALSLDAAPADRATALHGAGRLAFLQCDYDRARALLDRAVAASGEAGDADGIARATQTLGSIAREQGDIPTAIRHHTACLDRALTEDDPVQAARSRALIGFAHWLALEADAARAALTEALSAFERHDDAEGLATARIYLGGLAHSEGGLDEAADHLDRALALSVEAGFQEGIAWSRNLLGVLALDRDQLDEARTQLRRSLRRHHALGDAWRTASVLEALARTHLRRHHPERAAVLLGAARALRQALHTPVPAVEQPALVALEADLQAALDPAALARGLDQGAAADLDELVREERGVSGR